eukprot:XP_014783277.1 PREDICTED: uncharacterized protein LOC106878549 [Octopus bimaculoides]
MELQKKCKGEDLTTSSDSESEENSASQNDKVLADDNQSDKNSASRISIPITYAEPFTDTLTDGDSSSVGSKQSLDSEDSGSSHEQLVTSASSQSTLQMMNTKKWLGLKSGDKNFRQQLDGIFQNDKKPKKPKTRKKSDADSLSEQEDDQNVESTDQLSECGKENSVMQSPLSKKTHTLPRSFSCDERQPPRHQQNSIRQRTEINNNVHRRTCRYLSDSSVPPRSTTTGIQRQLSQHTSRKVTRSPVSTTKRLTKSQHNLSQNIDYANRSQSLGDLTSEPRLSLPNSSQKSHEPASTKLSSASSSRTLTSTLSRTTSRLTAQKTASGLYSHRLDKTKSLQDSQSHSLDTVNSCKKTQSSDTLHRSLSKSSLQYSSRPVSHMTHDNQHPHSSTSHLKQQSPQVHIQKHETPLQKTVSDGQQRYRSTKVFHPLNASLSRQINKISKANSVPQQESHNLYNDPPKPMTQIHTFSKSNVLDQHRKYGSTDSINKLKPRRSLPRVPSQSIDEKRRKFTELMKQRILLCSAGSSNNSQHADTPLDYEVSSLLSLNDIDTDDNCSDKLKFKPIESAADVWKFRSLQDLSVETNLHQSQPPVEWKQVVPVVCVENSDSNLTSQINARSHSSTVDSGYSTIDTEIEPCHSSSKLKAPGYYKPEFDKRLVKTKEYGSVDCLKANTLSTSKSYLYQHSPKSKHEQEYSTLLSAKSASLYNGSKWEPKSLSSQTLYSRSSRKLDNPHTILETTKSFSQTMSPRKTNITALNDNSINSISSPTQSGSKSPVTPTPDSVPNASLYQLIQMYNLYPTQVDVYNLCISKFISLERKTIHLPTSTSFGKSSPCSSGGQPSVPQGKYAKLGGPGSAFRPVRGCSASLSSMCEVSMTAIRIKSDCKSPPPLELLSIEDGDLIVEVNGIVVLDESIKAIQKIIDNVTDSLQLILAHPKQAIGCRSLSSCSNISAAEDIQTLKERIKLLLTELDHKEKVNRERNSAPNLLSSSSSTPSNHSSSWLAPSPNRTEHRPYYDDWEKNLESIKLGEDEFVV